MNKAPVPELSPFSLRLMRGAALLGGLGLTLTGCTSDGEARPVPSATASASAEASPSPTPDITPSFSSTPEAPYTERPLDPPTEKTDSDNEVVRGLDNLERRTHITFKGAMEFFQIPANTDERAEAISWHPDALWQINEVGYKPTTIIEPETSGYKRNPRKIDAYLKDMKAEGVEAKDWGRVVLVPEPMVGFEEQIEPDQYALLVNSQKQSFDEQFPGVETAILIDTAKAEFEPLMQSIQASRGPGRAPLAKFKSVGLQAYPNAGEVTFDPQTGKADISSYLSVKHIQRLAKVTGTKRVWINTGITREDKAGSFSYTTEQRIAIAHAIADVTRDAATAGIKIDDVMLFAEDKSDQPEGRDFSFQKNEAIIAETLYDRLHKQRVPLTGFAVRP